MSSSGGDLFDSGSFRVDRRRALDKLMRYELPDPEMFLLPLARCAVAGGAPSLRIQDGGGVSIRFGGRPFSADELADPYACLFEPAAAPARTHLASALLCALRLSPTLVSVASGGGGDRRRLRVWSPVSETLESVPSLEAETVVTLEDRRASHPEALAYLRERAVLSPVPVFVGAEALAPPGPAPDGLRFNEEGLRGWLQVPAEPGALSRLDLCVFGVSAERASVALPFIQADGAVNDDSLVMNPSQTAVARDARFARALERTGLRALELMLKTALGQEERLLALAALLREPALLHHWKDRLERGSAAEAADLSGFPEPLRAGLARIWSAARACLWLRAGEERLTGSAPSGLPEGAAAALRECPLFLGASGPPLSMNGIEALRHRLGHVPVARRPAPGGTPGPGAVLCVSDTELAWLERRYPGELRLTDGAPPAASPQASRPLSLEAAGLPSPLIRGAVSGSGAEGEAGLSLPVPRRGSRLHLFVEGRPALTVQVDGPLRFDAALEHPGLRPGEGTWEPWVSQVRSSVTELYRRLAGELDGPEGSDRQRAIRAHLLDFLEWADAGTSWIRAVPLFESDDERMSLERLRSLLSQGHSFHVSDGPGLPEGILGRRLALDGRCARLLLARLLPEARFEAWPAEREVHLMFCGGGAPDHPSEPAGTAGAPGARSGETAESPEDLRDPGLRFEEQMLLAARDSRQGLEILLGVASRFPPPPPVFRKGGVEVPRPKALSAGWSPPCAAVVDLSGWRDPDPADLESALSRAFDWFFGEIAGRWPLVELRGPLSWAAACHVLEFLRLRPEGEPALMGRLRRLPLFPTVGGGPLCVERLEAEVRRGRELVYAQETLAETAEEDRWAPVLNEPRRVLSLFADAGELALRRLEPRTGVLPESAPCDGESRGAVEPGSGDLAANLKDLLGRLLGLRGIRLTSAAVLELKMVREGGGGLVRAAPNGRLEIDVSHPLARAVLDSGLPDSEQAAYLATVVFTALNRLAPGISDRDDARFQQALAAELRPRGRANPS